MSGIRHLRNWGFFIALVLVLFFGVSSTSYSAKAAPGKADLIPTFVDVPFDHPYHDYIETLYQEGYTSGCSTEPLMYCPEKVMNRAESSVFLERGIHGAEYDPPDPTQVLFEDVALNTWYADWVHGLWNDGYTSGCGTDPLRYCPDLYNTRAEGAVFYLRMMFGADYKPPSSGKSPFRDVDKDLWYFDWVNAAYEAGIVEPCTTKPDLQFCPNEPLTRAVAAYMMVQAKGLPLATATPLPSPTITSEPTMTSTSTDNRTATPTNTSTETATPIPSSTSSSTPSNTPNPTSTFTSMPTNTPNPTSTPTSTLPSPTATPGTGNVYYVSTNGSDANPGTQSRPWQTIQKAADSLNSGDTVIVRVGSYQERVHVNRSGSLNNPITFQAEGVVVLKGFTITADNIHIDGFEITGAVHSDWRSGWGISVRGDNCRIEDNYVHYNTDGGISIDHRDDDHSTGCLIKNNRVYRNGQVGIEVHGREHVVEGNEIWGTIQYHPDWTSPWADADGFRVFGEGHILRNNYVHDINYDGVMVVNAHIDCFQTWDDSTHEVLKNSIIEKNRCIFTVEAGGPNATDKGVQLESGANNNIIRNNVFRGFHGIMFENGCSYNKIYSNTFISSLTPEGGGYTTAFHITNSPYNVFKNNIIYDVRTYIVLVGDSGTGLDVGYNLIYRSDGNLPSGNPYRNDLWGVDPQFVDLSGYDLHLSASSSAIDAGIELADVRDDYDGVLRPQGNGYDIGAYEYTN
jgi:parallel beta-helix repeat protein